MHFFKPNVICHTDLEVSHSVEMYEKMLASLNDVLCSALNIPVQAIAITISNTA